MSVLKLQKKVMKTFVKLCLHSKLLSFSREFFTESSKFLFSYAIYRQFLGYIETKVDLPL